ncbi:neuromedin U [Bizionia echini]|uniref:neuromedin U n=1 Tax=Bizionia echini TaxID=649333 RepID=UPI0030D88964
MKKFTLALCYALFSISGFTQEKFGDEDFIQDGTDLEDKIQNPIANMASIPLEYNLSVFDKNTNVLNIQPIIPIKISEKWVLITQTTLPIMNKPTSTGYENGLGNITFLTTITSAEPSNFTWGVGPVFMFPSVNKSLGFNKLSIGPSVTVVKQTKGFTFGLTLQNFFSVAGSSSTDNVNYLYSQILLSKKLKNDWYLYSSPNITANWNAETGQQWSIPLGAGAGKLITHNKYLPINFNAGIFKYVAHPTNADWLLQVQATFILK